MAQVLSSIEHSDHTSIISFPSPSSSGDDLHTSEFHGIDPGIGFDVDDILNDLDIFPEEAGSNAMLEPCCPTTHVPTITEKETVLVHHRPVSPASVESYNTDTSPVVVTQSSLETATSFSVPNPILSEDDFRTFKKLQPRKEEAEARKESMAGGGKKRKLSFVAECDDGKALTEEELQERRERNRSHARKSRQRKRSLTETLQHSATQLREENLKLRESIYEIIGQKKTLKILEARKQRARDQFLAGLMVPENRIIKTADKPFFKRLRKGIPKLDEE